MNSSYKWNVLNTWCVWYSNTNNIWCWIVFHFRFPHFHKQLGWRTERKCTQNKKIITSMYESKYLDEYWNKCNAEEAENYPFFAEHYQKEDSSFSFPCNSIGILMTLYYDSRCYGVIIHGLIIVLCISGITFTRFKEVWCKSKKEDQVYK